MSRRSKSKPQKRDWRWWASFVLNGAVALSMVLGTVFLFTGGSVGQQAPYVPPTATVGAPVAAPTATPAVSPTPASSLSGTSAPPAAVGQLNFAVAGDSRGGEAILAKIFDSVSTDGSEFLIHLGDYVNIDSEADWTRFADTLKRFKLPFYPVIGNHDFQRRPTNFFKYTGAKATHYSFDRGPVHFTIVDDSTAGLLDSEFEYLDQDLVNSQAELKMVFLHYPPFDPGGDRFVMRTGNDRFMKLVEERGVDYVFAGHIHCYGEEKRGAVQYIITGGAGAPLGCLPVTGGYYHYVRVSVQGTTVKTQVAKIPE